MAPDTSKGRRSRRRFEDEFKAQAVRLVLEEGKSIAAVAGDLDLTPSVLGRSVAQGRAPTGRRAGLGSPWRSARS